MHIHRHTRSVAAGAALLATLAVSGTAAATTEPGDTATDGTVAADVCVGTSNEEADEPTELTLALVPSGDANQLIETVKPLEAALTERLGIPVHGVITQDYQAAVEAIGSDQAQIGMLPSLQMSQACDRYGAVPALQTERNGRSTYAAQFFTNNPDKYCADEPVAGDNGMLYCNGTEGGVGPAGLESLTLIDDSITLLQAASPAGYIFPVAALQAAGVSLDDLDVTQVGANDASVLSVYNGDTEVGASYWDARNVVVADTPDVGEKLVVFALTNEIPNDGVSLSANLSAEWQEKIAEALKDFAGTDEGVEALKAIYSITGLVDADPASLAVTAQAAASIGLGG